MAYSKQTWTNDESAVLDTKMTHIEQGIYDNSLATDKINPSGTATTTAEIEEGQISDVIGFKSLKLKGQTSQETTQGNNLLNIYARHPAGYTETVSGVTFTYNYDGSVNAKGTATADIAYFLATNGQLGDDIFNGTNYLSGCTGGSTTTFFLQFWADTIGRFQNVTTEVATNKTAGVSWNIAIIIISGVAIDKTFYPMMSATSGKTFEKYTGGKASPSPDFSQDVNNVSGDNIVGISNKNIARLELVGQVRVNTNGIPQAISGFNGYIANVKPNTTYVSSCQNISTEYNKINNLCYFDDNMNFLSGNVYNGQNKTFTTPANCKYVSMAVNQAVVNFQLEQNSSATSYTAHQGNNFEINLGKNLFNKENIIEGKRLTNDPLNQLTDAEGYYTSSFIKVNSNTTYTKNSPLADAFHRFAFYSSNSESGYLSISNENTIVTPSECKYVRFSGKINELDTTQLEKGAIATSFADYFPPIELCKIGTYADYIYKKDGKWWKHKEVEKITLNGSETPTINTSLTNTTRALYSNILPYNAKAGTGSGICNLLLYYENWVTDVEGFYLDNNTTNLVFRINKSTVGTTITSVNNFLSENNMTVYYIVETAIEEEITYAPLIRQLDELYNSGLYDVTNISQDNSSEAFILDFEACKNNINGIVEYIRR